MATFAKSDDSVVVIIGSGAGGGTLGNALAQKGVKVVMLEAGARQSTDSYINDEWASFAQLAWIDPRSTTGSWRIARDFPTLPAWICKTVGGTTTHFAGASLRFKPYEFKARTTYGEIAGANLLDWPIGLEDLEPYYAKAENLMGVTRTNGIPGLPGNNNFRVMYKGAKAVGYKDVHTGRMAINSEPRDERTSCHQLGFCFQGCKMGAKWSTLYTAIPAAEETDNFELRTECQVVQIQHDKAGKASGVLYVDAAGKSQVQKARIVAVAGNAIESPRLLLNSESAMFPDGLGNASGQVGRNYMRHTTGSVFGVFPEKVHFFRGTVMAGIINDENLNDPKRGFVGGYHLETISLGLPFTASFMNPGGWGRSFAADMDAYPHMAGMWIVGEDMPRETNRVTLDATVKDKAGMPVASVHVDDHENDEAMRNHAYKAGANIYEAAGATRSILVPPYPSTHNLGTNRMSAREADGVVNKFGQSWQVNNLFVSDGSQFTTGAAENPTLTIVALALRQADYIAEQMAKKVI
ncbi:Choline dehydrogenase [Arboricoccus pini]|uniref:Choline dehydrogenase n=1 Tax=Arboricoccus pini TaxID=1963835 RepID=A0A212RZS0_9PROT|nr:GMC family oxidoreductase [Arboricoccus pini]SNB78348.1 Choline dehydrogenase [Arboricoccus pini]